MLYLKYIKEGKKQERKGSFAKVRAGGEKARGRCFTKTSKNKKEGPTE